MSHGINNQHTGIGEAPVPGYQCQMVFIAEQLLRGALQSPDKAYTSNFRNNMAPVFASTGFALMPFQYFPFDEFAKSPDLGLDALFTRALTGDAITELDFPSIKCAACKVAAWSLAGLIVAAGTAALSTLVEGSAIVIGLASFAGVAPSTALLFAKTLGGAVTKGVGAVVQAICDWVGLCS